MRGFVVCLLVVLSACGESSETSLHVKSVEDIGTFPLPSTITIGRDGAYSGALGGKLLWTFGDTFTTERNSIDNSNVLSATGGWSTVDDPLALVQPLRSDNLPAQLIPYTADELAANQANPQTGWGLWPCGMFDTGDAEGLVVFQRIKRDNGSFESEGVATARIAIDATTATRTGDLFVAPEPLFIPQLVDDGYIYAVACEPSGFLNQSCKLARAPVAMAEQRSAYEFWDGDGYSSDVTRATEFIDRGNAPSIAWNAHLGRYLSVVSEILSNTVLVRTAPAIEGPWDDGVEILPSDTGVLAPPNSNDRNYLALQHVELDSPDGTQIVISYSRPTAPFAGDVRLARVTLE